jgi:hypothetical protein
MSKHVITVALDGDRCSAECPWLEGEYCSLFRGDKDMQRRLRAPEAGQFAACWPCQMAVVVGMDAAKRGRGRPRKDRTTKAGV